MFQLIFSFAFFVGIQILIISYHDQLDVQVFHRCSVGLIYLGLCQFKVLLLKLQKMQIKKVMKFRKKRNETPGKGNRMLKILCSRYDAQACDE